MSPHAASMDEAAIIVVPCFNEAARLDVAAFSRFIETHARYRFLLVDDGSQDETGQVLETMT